MATLLTDVGAPYTPAALRLSDAQTGNGVSTNMIDRGGRTGPMMVQITTTVGSTPTCTYAIQGSIDGVTWFNAPIADLATPGTVSVATFNITSATTVQKLVLDGFPYRYLRVNMTANTNVTSTIDVIAF